VGSVSRDELDFVGSPRSTELSVLGLVLGVAVGVLLAAVLLRSDGEGARVRPPHTRSAERVPADDALAERVLGDLRSFTDWLVRDDAEGWIGEVGWPAEDADEWNRVAEAWYRAANDARLWVTAWAAGEWWAAYSLAIYNTGDGATLSAPGPQAEVVEDHLGPSDVLRGINVNGPEFGVGGNLGLGTDDVFSNRNRGTYGRGPRGWHHESHASLDYLASRGIEVVRVPFRWERLQPSLGQPLDAKELDRLTEMVDRIAEVGMVAIPSAFNYGAYWLNDETCGCGRRTPIGSAAVTIDHFVDLWTRLSEAFEGSSSVVAYGIMGEPVGMSGPEVWEEASQEVVDALREQGDETLVMVPGYSWSGVQSFPIQHPNGPWIEDPADRVRYEAHHYWDSTYAGDYDLSYAEENDAAVASKQLADRMHGSNRED
jgi:hypothetical protein